MRHGCSGDSYAGSLCRAPVLAGHISGSATGGGQQRGPRAFRRVGGTVARTGYCARGSGGGVGMGLTPVWRARAPPGHPPQPLQGSRAPASANPPRTIHYSASSEFPRATVRTRSANFPDPTGQQVPAIRPDVALCGWPQGERTVAGALQPGLAYCRLQVVSQCCPMTSGSTYPTSCRLEW